MHTPVMLAEVLRFAGENNPRKILDVTFGRGGHTRAMLEAFPQARVFGIDQDTAAIEFGREKFTNEPRLKLEHLNFHDIANFHERDFDVILADLGVSSPQLDQAERGFSFYQDGPLDMRMNQTQTLTAEAVVNTWSEVELLDLFTRYGEVRRPMKVVRAICADRKLEAFRSTLALAQMIERVEGWQRKGHHPATRYFLALRMAVNDELGGLERALPDLMRALSPTGRLIVITFHSLEDRITKYAFKEAKDLGFPLTKKVVIPSREEEKANPRARSAKLRVFQRGTNEQEELE